MLNLKKNPILVVKVCLLLLIGAFAINMVGTAFTPRAQAAGNSEQIADSTSELPSFRNLNGIIPNSADIPPVSLGSFLQKVVKTTGIYAFITDAVHGETPAGAPITVYGWQELLMVAVGFLIVYLGAVKGFEPLLLIPIGFGTIFVNIPLAGMGATEIVQHVLVNGEIIEEIVQHPGFLDIIYEAGVGNEFFPLIILISRSCLVVRARMMGG